MTVVVFYDQEFQVAERIGLMPLMRFAKIQQGGVETDSMAGFAVMYDLLEQCFTPSEWQRFQDHASAVHADAAELMGLVKDVVELINERPTLRSSDSSDGPLTTEPTFTSDSLTRAVTLFPGRPDLQIAMPGVREAS